MTEVLVEQPLAVPGSANKLLNVWFCSLHPTTEGMEGFQNHQLLFILLQMAVHLSPSHPQEHLIPSISYF